MPYPFFYGVAMYGGYYEPLPKPTPPTVPPREEKPARPPRQLSEQEIAADKMWLNDCSFRAAFGDVAQNITPAAPAPVPPKPPTPPPNRTVRY